MKEKNNIPNQNNECIPSEMLLRYLKGDLSGAERNRVERHVASCTMCSDELEGLSQLKNPDQIDEISNRLNERIDLLVEEPWDDKSVLRTYLKIAAILVLFIGISSVVYFSIFRKPSDIVPSYAEMEAFDLAQPPMEVDSNKEHLMQKIGGVDLTENRKSEAKDKKSPKQEISKSLDEKSVRYVAPVIVDSVKVDNEMLVVDEVREEAEVESVTLDDSNKEQKMELPDSAKITEVVTSQAAPVSADKKTVFTRAQFANEELVKGIVSKEETNKTYDARKQTALGLLSNSKYKEALKIFDRLCKDNPNNDSLIYYKSICNYQLKRFEVAISSLQQITVNPQGVFYNEAKWYYGLSLVAVGRNQEAVIVFEQIVKENSPFKDNASKELEKLKSKY